MLEKVAPVASETSPATLVGEAPRGRTFISNGWVGPAAVLRGDVVAAFGGARKGLWRFRCDRDDPPEQIVPNPEILDEPAGAIGTMISIFVINRSSRRAHPEHAPPDDQTHRILRLAGRRLVPCRTDQPVPEPRGIFLGVRDGGLFVVTGSPAPGEPRRNQLLELLPGAPGEGFSVREIASHFVALSESGVDGCKDGKRLLVSD